jgi:hypothetical protein
LRLLGYHNKKHMVGHKEYVFDGSLNVEHNGFDGSAVPTLVDLDGPRVFVNSSTIMQFLTNT